MPKVVTAVTTPIITIPMRSEYSATDPPSSLHKPDKNGNLFNVHLSIPAGFKYIILIKTIGFFSYLFYGIAVVAFETTPEILLPNAVTTAAMATVISPRRRAYSAIDAPSSPFKNCSKVFIVIFLS